MSALLHPPKSKDIDANVWLHLSRAGPHVPFLSDTLAQLIHIFDFPAANLLLKNAFYLLICNRLDYLQATVMAGWSLVSCPWSVSPNI